MLRLFVILSLAFLNPQWAFSKVIIQGKIVNYDGTSVVSYHPTLEGIYTPYWKTIKPTSAGRFSIEFETEGLGVATVSYKGVRYRFLIDRDVKITVEFDQQIIAKAKRKQGVDPYLFSDSLKQVATLKIGGDFEKVNKFYNQSLRSSYSITRSVSGNYYSKLVDRANTPIQALHLIDSLSNLEIKKINELPLPLGMEDLNAQKNEQEIRDYLTNEVHAFYGAILVNTLFLKRKEHIYALLEDSTATPNIYNPEWEKLVEQLTENTYQKIKPSPNSPDYQELTESLAVTLEGYKKYYFPQKSPPLDEVVTNQIFRFDSTLFNNDKSKFAHQLNELQRFLNDQLFYSPALLQATYILEEKYPQSAHLKFYQPQINKLKASIEASKKEFHDAKIIDSNHNSLASLLKQFQGENVLIDIWATWCQPCIEEFEYKSLLKPYQDNDQLALVYISIDKAEWKDRWKQSLAFNQLKGYHYLANKKFIQDLWSSIGEMEGAIPRYVLIDKKGEIFIRTAARPSHGNLLISQIEELIKSN